MLVLLLSQGSAKSAVGLAGGAPPPQQRDVWFSDTAPSWGELTEMARCGGVRWWMLVHPALRAEQ